MLTIAERFGTLEGLRLAYIGDARNNVALSLARSRRDARRGRCTSAARRRTAPRSVSCGARRAWAAHNGGTARAFTSPVRAVREVDVVYTDVWTSMGEEQYASATPRCSAVRTSTAELMTSAAAHAIFMHCLPAHRGEEVTDEVIDGPRASSSTKPKTACTRKRRCWSRF